MKLTNFLLKGRAAQSDKVPLQEIMPLKLKNKVSGKFDQVNDKSCVSEVLNLINCLSENENENKHCKKEYDQLNSCYNDFRKSKAELKVLKEKGLLLPEQRKFTHMQIRTLLRKYPIK